MKFSSLWSRANKPLTRRQFLKVAAAGSGAAALVGSYPVFVERYIISVNHYRIAVPRLPESFAGLRIVHLTDLHYGLLVPLSLIRWVVRKVNALEKDLVVCTGDYIHERNATAQIDAVWPELGKLKAPLGAFSVLGNHDHWGSTDRSQYWLEKTGQNLNHLAKPIERNGERLWVVGAGDFMEDDVNLDSILQGVPEKECRVVLAHNPDTADTGFTSRVDLMIAGHTHGGQVKIPFIGTPILPVQNRNYTCGLKESRRGDKVFISRGIGWAYLPIRFNCPPEIAVLELQPERS